MFSIVDRHRFDANLDPYRYPNLYSDADAELDADWHPNDADPIRILSQVLHMFENQKIISLTFTAVPVYIVLSFSLWSKVS